MVSLKRSTSLGGISFGRKDMYLWISSMNCSAVFSVDIKYPSIMKYFQNGRILRPLFPHCQGGNVFNSISGWGKIKFSLCALMHVCVAGSTGMFPGSPGQREWQMRTKAQFLSV